jgi:hypothetical protein
LLQELRTGDVLVIWKLDRLGRSLRHLVDLAATLLERDVGLKSLSDPIDTTTPQGRLTFNLLASLAEFEKDLMRERTQAGLSAARARGRKGDAPKDSPRRPNGPPTRPRPCIASSACQYERSPRNSASPRARSTSICATAAYRSAGSAKLSRLLDRAVPSGFDLKRRQLPSEALIDLRRRLADLAPRSAERRLIMKETAALYGISESSLYRALRERARPKALQRADRGVPRILPQSEFERFCEVIAALKIRTSNEKGRHLSTVQAIRLLEEHGVETPDGLLRAPRAVLTRSTVNRYLKQWGFDYATLTRVPAAVRFQARHSNDCWHFDLSPSDLKQVKRPAWFDEGRGHPLLMLYSVVDDRSGMAYQEYHGVYGEDVEAALRFLFKEFLAQTAKNLHQRSG